MQRCHISQEKILHGDDTHRPQTSPPTLNRRHVTTCTSPRLHDIDDGITPCTEKSQERLFRSWQYYSEENKDSEVTKSIRCMTADIPGCDSPPACSFPGVIALDWFLPAVRYPASAGQKCTGAKQHRGSRTITGKACPVLLECASGLRGGRIDSNPPPMTPWASSVNRCAPGALCSQHVCDCNHPIGTSCRSCSSAPFRCSSPMLLIPHVAVGNVGPNCPAKQQPHATCTCTESTHVDAESGNARSAVPTLTQYMTQKYCTHATDQQDKPTCQPAPSHATRQCVLFCRPMPATAPHPTPSSEPVQWHASLFGASTGDGHALSRSCTTAPHRLFSAWPDPLERRCSPAGTPQPQIHLEDTADLMEPGSFSPSWASPDRAAADGIDPCRPQTADTCTVTIHGGLAATGTVMAHRRALTPAGMSMLLTVAQQQREEDLSVQVQQPTC